MNMQYKAMYELVFYW